MVAPGDGIFDERIARAEIEQIVFVDAGRNQQQRRLLDLGRLRRVLNELDEIVLVHDLSGRDGKIAADLEGGLVNPRDPALLEILDQILHSGRQTCGPRLDRGANDVRIGRRKIRRAHRIDILPGIETQLKLQSVVDLRLVDELGQLLRIRKIGLLEQLVERRMLPRFVLEAPVAARGLVVEVAAPEIHHGRPELLLHAHRGGEWRLRPILCGITVHADRSRQRVIERFGRLLAGLHQAFKIGGGTVLQGWVTHHDLPQPVSVMTRSYLQSRSMTARFCVIAAPIMLQCTVKRAPARPVTPPAVSRGCGTTRSSSAPTPGPSCALPRSRRSASSRARG